MADSMTARIVLALLLAVGFYCLALGMAAGLIFLIYAQLFIWDWLFYSLVVPAGIGAFVILWSILPRFDRFYPPGPRLRAEEHPALFAEIQRVAADVNQPMPREVYLIPDVNAFVMQRGGIMGIGSRRVMAIGLALLASVSRAQFRAVLAHEFGHYYGGDTRLAPWVYKTRLAIIRTIEGLGDSWLQWPFRMYGIIFLILTEAVSRRQEFQADQLASRAYGAEATAGGLRRVAGMAPAFEGFFGGNMVPVLLSGYRPPLVEGFQKFQENKQVAPLIEQTIAEELESGETDPFDTHPSLKDRIEALGNPPDDRDAVEPLALELLNDLTALELALISGMSGNQEEFGLKPVAWDEVGDTALVPVFREMVRENQAILQGLTPQMLPDRAHRLLRIKYEREEGEEPDEEEPESSGAQLVAMSLTSWLTAKGWRVVAWPGDELRVVLDEVSILPFSVVENLADGTISKEQWLETVQNAGIASVDLGQSPVS